MKTIKTLAVVGFLSTLLSCNTSSIKGDGNIQSEQRPIASFKKIEIGGNWEVIVTQGETESLKIEADKNLLDLIETKVDGDALIIGTKNNKSLSSEKGFKAYLTFKNLDKIELSGAVKLSAPSRLIFDKLNIEGSGAAEINLDLNAKQLDAEMSGGSQTILKGSINEVHFTLSGAGSLSALELESNKFTVDISGAGTAEVSVKDELNATISGAGSVSYKGNPVVKKDISGAGKIFQLK
jgi:hypothetical protein